MLYTSSKSLSTDARESSVELCDLGIMPYGDAWRVQHELLLSRVKDEIPDTLLCVEHPHVITLGRKSPEYAMVESQGLTHWQNVPLFVVERGGEATYHGPGQLVMYPIFKLSPRFGARAFLRLLEESLIETLAHVGLSTHWREGATGVWLESGKKIASLGIAVRHSVSYHGLALNLTTDLSYFKKIKPCGFTSDVMTRLMDHTQVSSVLVRELLAQSIRKRSQVWRA